MRIKELLTNWQEFESGIEEGIDIILVAILAVLGLLSYPLWKPLKILYNYLRRRYD